MQNSSYVPSLSFEEHVKRHAEFTRVTPGHDTVVLFVHGILSSPAHFADDYPLVPANYDIVSILLPGHGGTAEDFARAGMAEWQGYVRGWLDALRGRYKHILCVGHSMGTLLLSVAIADRPAGVERFFLMNSPLYISVKPDTLPYFYRYTTERLRANDPFDVEAARIFSVHGRLVPEAALLAPNNLALIPKSVAARRALKKLTERKLPLYAIHSLKDEVISISSARFLEKLGVRLEILSGSSHFYYAKRDKDTIQRMLGEFFANAE